MAREDNRSEFRNLSNIYEPLTKNHKLFIPWTTNVPHHYSGVSIFNFEQAVVSWAEVYLRSCQTSIPEFFWLTFNYQCSLSYRNQSINLQSKLMDWFLYDRDLRHEQVKLNHIELQTLSKVQTSVLFCAKSNMIIKILLFWHLLKHRKYNSFIFRPNWHCPKTSL